VLVGLCLPVQGALGEAQVAWETSNGLVDIESIASEPVICGYGRDRVELESVSHADALDDPDRFAENWIVQMSERDPDLERYARIQGGRLHVHDPRGATIWFKNRISGPVMITYRVTLPNIPGDDGTFAVRDLNNFWMATSLAGDLFDGSVYTGDFHTYRKMQGYYASTGGGKNTTTRMRRYPRAIGGELVQHSAWTALDGRPDYLLTPDQEILVQLVAFDDIVQYYNNGKLFYEAKRGDPITTMSDGNKETGEAVWGEGEYTPYAEGYFGFRSTHSHHVIRDFRVYRLKPL